MAVISSFLVAHKIMLQFLIDGILDSMKQSIFSPDPSLKH